MNDEFVEPTVQAIIKAGRSGEEGKVGDGKIFILLPKTASIRTGERGPRLSEQRQWAPARYRVNCRPPILSAAGRRCRANSATSPHTHTRRLVSPP